MKPILLVALFLTLGKVSQVRPAWSQLLKPYTNSAELLCLASGLLALDLPQVLNHLDLGSTSIGRGDDALDGLPYRALPVETSSW